MVAAQERRAAAVGAEILRRGGNAVDAAVATSFSLAVTLPQAGNIGGGGFLVLWLPRRGPISTCAAAARQPALPQALPIGRGEAVAVNFRETAPQAARADLFLNPDGSVNRERATRSLLSTAVPGSVAGLAMVQRRYGCLPLATVLQPAIDLAERGFPVGTELADSLRDAAPLLGSDPTSRRLFVRLSSHADGAKGSRDPLPNPYRPGELLRQPELAESLRCIAREGASCFYRGRLGQALVRLMRQRGGLISAADLAAYRAPWMTPLSAPFRGHRVLTMPPPSGGGATLLQLLQVLEPLDLASMGLNSAASLHPMVEAMNLAYRDRNRLLGDPDQVAMPLDRLLSGGYAAAQRQRIRADLRARNSYERVVEWALFACSGIAVLTTIGIVLSIVFEAVRFFQLIPITDFLFGLHWSPQMAIRADQVGSSGAFGAVPLFTGTLLISAIAMVVAAPIGLLSAIYLAEYADRRARSHSRRCPATRRRFLGSS